MIKESMVDQLFSTPLERRQFENGLVALHQSDFSMPVVSVQVWVHTGSIHEGKLNGSGLSHYLEHMLFKGTEVRDANAISREVHSLGGLINAYTTFDRTVYYIDCPAVSFRPALEILSDIVVNSTLPPIEVERERDVILREIDMGLDDPDQCLSRALFNNAYRRHPYREPVIGHRSLFERVEHAELLNYYKSRYIPNNITVCTAGAISFTECFDAVQKQFGSVPRGRLSPVSIEAEPIQLSARRETLRGDYTITRGGLAFKVPHLSDKDSPPLDALAQALGGGESSILWQQLRNQQNLVHYIDCRNWNPGDSGLFWISYVCDPGKQSAVESAVYEVIQDVSNQGVDQKVLEKVFRQALSSEVSSRKTMSGRASKLGLGEVVVGDAHYGKHYFERLQSIDSDDISRVASHYLIESRMTAVIAEPKPVIGTHSAVSDTPPEEFTEAIQTSTLSDGIRLVLQPDQSLPKVHLRAVLLGGAHYEPKNQRGISSLLAELLTKDTENRTALEVAELLETRGGQFSATAGNNSIQLAIEVFPDDLPIAVELLSEALKSPRFDEKTFQTELDAQISLLKEQEDEIFEYGFRLLREKFFGDHPFSIGPYGRTTDLEGLDLAALHSYYRRIVQATNVVISVCGDFIEEDLRGLLECQLEGRLLSDGFDLAPARTLFPSEGSASIEPMNREQALVLMGFPDSGVRNDSRICGEVLNEVCSGMSSRLFERVREEQGLAYYVGSTRVIGLEEGMFTLYAGTHTEAVDAVIKEMRDEVSRIAAGSVPEEELARCRTRLKAARLMNRQTIGARAMQAGMSLAYGIPIEKDSEYASKVDAVDSEALAAFVCSHLDLEKRQQLIVRPA
ncbi:MAG: M16 family metallopeptidase [Coraliomargaritaceae bacterium]